MRTCRMLSSVGKWGDGQAAFSHSKGSGKKNSIRVGGRGSGHGWELPTEVCVATHVCIGGRGVLHKQLRKRRSVHCGFC